MRPPSADTTLVVKCSLCGIAKPVFPILPGHFDPAKHVCQKCRFARKKARERAA